MTSSILWMYLMVLVLLLIVATMTDARLDSIECDLRGEMSYSVGECENEEDSRVGE